MGLIISLFFSIFFLICWIKIYQKAGREWWESIIPFYSNYVLAEIAGRKSKFKMWLIPNLIRVVLMFAFSAVVIPLAKASGTHFEMSRDVETSEAAAEYLTQFLTSGLGIYIVIAGIIGLVCSIVSLIATVSIFCGLAESFGKEPWYGILIILFSGICIPILALSTTVSYVGGSSGGGGKKGYHYSGDNYVPDYSSYLSEIEGDSTDNKQ